MKVKPSKTYGMQKSSSKKEVYSDTLLALLPQESRKKKKKKPNFTLKTTRERRTNKT